MMMTKLKIAAGFMLAVGLVGVGVGQIGAGPPGKEQPPVAKAAPAEARVATADDGDKREQAELQLRHTLTDASRKRAILRLRIEEGKDQVAELKRDRDAWQKGLSSVEGHLDEQQQIVDSFKRSAKEKPPTKDEQEGLSSSERTRDYMAQEVNKYKAGLRQAREELTNARRELFAAEEELTLLEQLTTWEIDKLRRQS